MKHITHEELIAEIQRINTRNADGATVTELAERTGRSRDVILNRLRATAKEGRLVVGRKQVLSVDGRPAWALCYKVTRGKRS